MPVLEVNTKPPQGVEIVYCYQVFRNCPMFDTLFEELNDMPGEIYDVIEYKEEWEKDDKFNVEDYLKGDTDY